MGLHHRGIVLVVTAVTLAAPVLPMAPVAAEEPLPANSTTDEVPTTTSEPISPSSEEPSPELPPAEETESPPAPTVGDSGTPGPTLEAAPAQAEIVVDAVPDDPQDVTLRGCRLGTDGACEDEGLEFVLDDDADPTRSNSHLIDPLPAGTYQLTQTASGHLVLTAITCNGAAAPAVDLARRRITITVTDGQVIRCTFHQKAAGLTLVHNVVGTDGQDFTYDFCPDGGGPCQTATLDEDENDSLPSTQRFPVQSDGTYTLTQREVPGWGVTALSCDGAADTDRANRRVTITLDVDDVVTCTYQNRATTLTVVVDRTPDSGEDFAYTGCRVATNQCSTFTLDDDNDPTLPRSLAWVAIPPGEYAVTQAEADGSGVTSVTCTGTGSASTNVGARRADVQLEPGSVMTCTFSSRATTLTVQVSNGAHYDDFTFTGCRVRDDACSTFQLDDDTDPALPTSLTYSGLESGTYTIHQDGDDRWGLYNILCGGEQVDVAAHLATVHLAPGEQVTCVFVNVRNSITVSEYSRPLGAGAQFGFSFCPTAGGDCTAFSLDNDPGGAPSSMTFDRIPPGAYVITQDEAPGWPVTGIGCSVGEARPEDRQATVVISPGEQVICTFTNTRPSITLTENVNGTDAQDFEFTICPVAGGACLPPVLLDDDSDPALAASSTVGPLEPGTYRIRQTPVSTWALTQITCNPSGAVDLAAREVQVSLGPGEQLTCTFANSRTRLVVNQTTTPEHDQDFTYELCRPDTSCSTFALDDDSDPTLPASVAIPLEPGTHVISQDVVAGHGLTALTCGSSGLESLADRRATLQVQPGTTVTCQFTNRPTRLTLSLDSSPEHVQDFALEYCVPSVPCAAVTLDDDSDATHPSSVVIPTVPGRGMLTVAPVAGWGITSLSCTSSYDQIASPSGGWLQLNQPAGSSPICTVRVSQTRLTITNGTSADYDQPIDFTHCPPASPCLPFILDEDADGPFPRTRIIEGAEPGVHVVTQQALPATWALTSLTCTAGDTDVAGGVAVVVLTPGDQVTCTFTSRATRVRLVLSAPPTFPVELPVTRCGPAAECTTFTIDQTGATDPPGQAQIDEVVAGRYTFELGSPPDRWAVVGLSCPGGETDVGAGRAEIILDPGQQRTCTVTLAVTRIAVGINVPDGPQQFAFTGCRVADGACGPFVLDDDPATPAPERQEWGPLEPGDYTVEAHDVPGWGLTSLSCPGGTVQGNQVRVTVILGQELVCSVVFRQTTFRVELPSSTSGTQPFTFTGCRLADEACADFSLDRDTSTPAPFELTFSGLDPGRYRVSQHAQPGWGLTSLDCGTGAEVELSRREVIVEVRPGDARVCRFTNRQNTLSLTADSVPDNDVPVTFERCAPGGTCTTITLDGDPDTNLPGGVLWQGVVAGTYTITQADLGPGVITEIECSGGADIDLDVRRATIGIDPAESGSCTFRNRMAGLRIAIDTSPSSTQRFSFEGCRVATGECSTFVLADFTTLTRWHEVHNIPPGLYRVTQESVPGWALASITCSPNEDPDPASGRVDIFLTPGEHVSCTFVNER